MRTPVAVGLAALLCSGCAQFAYDDGYWGHSPRVYQPTADGPAAVTGASALIPDLHIAYVHMDSSAPPRGHPGSFGPGVALFSGLALQAFSVDGDLGLQPPQNAQPGFFWRPSSIRSGDSSLGELEARADQLIAWGSWANVDARVVTRGNLADNLHYVIGEQTPTSGFPASGLVRYDMIGSTDAGGGRRAISSSISVLWGSATPKVGLDLAWGDPGSELFPGSFTLKYHLATPGGIADPGNPSNTLSLRAGTATFGATFLPMDLCTPDHFCRADIEGFLVGPLAERAGIAYHVSEVGRGGNTRPGFSGVLALAAVSSETMPPAATVVPLDPAGPFDMVRAGGPADATTSLSSLGVMTQNQATGAIEGFGQAAFTNELARGTAQSADVGGDALITWGRWTNGSYEQVQTFGNTPVALGAEQALHYVIGATTPGSNIPASGTASFSLMGATKPTFGDGALAAGTLAGSMSVSWGGAAATKVGMDLTVTMPGDASYSVVTAGGLASPSLSQVQTFFGAQFFGTVPVASAGRACTSNPAGCGANIAGFFAGPAAERAGIAYQLGSGNAQQSIHGAAAFKR
jgi:hypothetical protein